MVAWKIRGIQSLFSFFCLFPVNCHNNFFFPLKFFDRSWVSIHLLGEKNSKLSSNRWKGVAFETSLGNIKMPSDWPSWFPEAPIRNFQFWSNGVASVLKNSVFFLLTSKVDQRWPITACTIGWFGCPIKNFRALISAGRRRACHNNLSCLMILLLRNNIWWRFCQRMYHFDDWNSMSRERENYKMCHFFA